MRHYFILCLFCLTAFPGCAELIRVDSETYMRNPGMYEGKYTLISADLEEVVENYQLYEGLDIEIAAPITHFEERDAPSWFLILEKNGKISRHMSGVISVLSLRMQTISHGGQREKEIP